MRELLDWILVALVWYMTLAAVLILLGLGVSITKDYCPASNGRRIEYAFPFYRVGCWLGEKTK